MGASAMVKFMDRVNGNGRGLLHWGRADIDGAPWRGAAPLNLTEEELESRATRVGDFKNRVFDLSLPADNRSYIDVMDMIVSGWATQVYIKRVLVKTSRGHLKVRVYLEWIEAYMEDGKPFDSQRPYIGRSND